MIYPRNYDDWKNGVAIVEEDEDELPTPDKYVEEASSLWLPPGKWPESIQYHGLIWQRNKMAYSNGELVSVIYNRGDKELHILND